MLLLFAKATGRCLSLVFLAVFLFFALGSQESTGQASGEQTPPASAGQAAAPAQAPDPNPAIISPGTGAEATELWSGALFTSTYRVGLCFAADGKIRGALHLRLSSGKVDVYHVVGKVKNNVIEAGHSSGHTFKGRLLGQDLVEGVITLKSGRTISLEGQRRHDVPLVAGDCAPLPLAEGQED